MSTQKPSSPDLLSLVVARKLVLLLLLMITTAMGLVSLLLQARLSIPVLAFLLSDGIFGLVAGFSVRWILPRKARVLRICCAVAFITGGLALLGWFTGWGFGIDLLRVGRTRVNWWEISQILLATCFALLALYAWQPRTLSVPPATRVLAAKKSPRARRKPLQRPNRVPGPYPASPAISQIVRPASPEIPTQPVKPKRKRTDHAKPRLLLSDQEEHRCPYCLELIDRDDQRGVVECEICHTLHHADCWAITGACQVPHFTA
jgi:hypothetical protein